MENKSKSKKMECEETRRRMRQLPSDAFSWVDIIDFNEPFFRKIEKPSVETFCDFCTTLKPAVFVRYCAATFEQIRGGCGGGDIFLGWCESCYLQKKRSKDHPKMKKT